MIGNIGRAVVNKTKHPPSPLTAAKCPSNCFSVNGRYIGCRTSDMSMPPSWVTRNVTALACASRRKLGTIQETLKVKAMGYLVAGGRSAFFPRREFPEESSGGTH